MAAVARAFGVDSVASPDGAGFNCASPTTTSTGPTANNRVFSDGLLVCHFGDIVAPHAITGCGTDSQSLDKVSTRVFVMGKGIGRIGDQYGDNVITSGSSRVFAG